MAEEIQVISTTLVQARSNNNNGYNIPKMDLTPWDLQVLHLEHIQKGLLFHNPRSKETYVQHLKHSLSSTLDLFFPLAGRLAISQHDDDNTVSVSITCNNEGALFVHAIAKSITISDILEPVYVPRVVDSLFPLNGVKNHEGTSKPLLGVQVTELIDGIFIGCSMNHAVVDGKSFWHFFSSWAEISRGLDRVSKLPHLERWFLEGIEKPIRFPFTKESPQHSDDGLIPPPTPPSKRVFHFTKEKIAHLKAKVNTEVNTNKISSLQALLTYVWRSVIRNQHLDPKEDVSFVLDIDARPRILQPQLPENYFGKSIQTCKITMKAGELLIEEGLGNTALEMNKMIALHTEEKLKGFYEFWVKNPELLGFSSRIKSNRMVPSSSPRFDIYGNDFGWGKPVAARSGAANKASGKVTLFAGEEEGSIDIELCASFEILEALSNDPQFMDFVSI